MTDTPARARAGSVALMISGEPRADLDPSVTANFVSTGTPKKQVSRDTGISRQTINKMLRHENPPGYGPRLRPTLGPYIPAIDRLVHEILLATPAAGLTIRGIVERLRREQGSILTAVAAATCNGARTLEGLMGPQEF
jgi:hypothetical protein